MSPEEFSFCAWLRNEFKITPEQALNELNEKEVSALRQEFIQHQQSQQQPQIIQTNLPNSSQGGNY